MVRIEIGLVINRLTEDVFAFVSNSENLPQWRATTTEVKKTSEGPTGVGTTFRSAGHFLGRQIEGSFVVTDYAPNRTYATKNTTGPFPLAIRYTLEPVGGDTQLIFVAEGEPGGFFKLAEPLVVNMAKRQFEADLHNLKELMETRPV